MFPKKLPEGYTIAFIEGKMSEDGIFPALALSKQQDALEVCWQDACLEASLEQEHWQQLVRDSDVYPERCAHYVALIEQIRGDAPYIKRRSHPYEVEVLVPSHRCTQCLAALSPFCITATTIEEALAEAAERVYALRCLCERMQDERLTLVA